MPKMGSGSRPTPPPKPSIPPAVGAAAVPAAPKVAQPPLQTDQVAQPPVKSGDNWQLVEASLREMSTSLKLINDRLGASTSSHQGSGEPSSVEEPAEESQLISLENSSAGSPMETSSSEDSTLYLCEKALEDLASVFGPTERLDSDSTDL